MAPRPKPPPKSKNWIVTSFLAAGALTYIFGLFVPKQEAIAQARARVREMQQEIIQSARLQSVIHQMQEELADTRQSAQEWRDTAPSARQLGELFGQITRHANEAGVSIQRFTPRPVLDLNLLHEIPVTLAVEGEFRSIFDLVRRLETLPGAVWIERIQMQPADGSQRLQCELALAIFADQAGNSD